MAWSERFSAKTRARLESQIGRGEQIVMSAAVGPVVMVLTDRRLLVGPHIQAAGEELNLPLSSISNVTWMKGILGSRGEIAVITSAQTYRYKAMNKEGQTAAEAIRKAIADL